MTRGWPTRFPLEIETFSTRAIRPWGCRSLGAAAVAVVMAFGVPALAIPLLLDPEKPPEDPLPVPPPPLSVAPEGPVAKAPDARDLLTKCQKDASFTDCFHDWKPPAPPPSAPATASTGDSPGAPSPKPPEGTKGDAPKPEDKKPDKAEPLKPVPPPQTDKAADQATYDALVKAIHENGLDGKVLLPDAPKEGSATMQVTPTAKPSPSRKEPKSP